MLAQLDRLRIEKPALAVARDVLTVGVVWIKPERLAEVEHRGLTADGLLRHPAFRGLRAD